MAEKRLNAKTLNGENKGEGVGGRMGQPVVIQISKDEIERCEVSRLAGILDGFVPELCERNRNRVDIELLGYLDDPRELYDISEAKKYFRHYFDTHNGWFYWVNTESSMLVLMGLLLFSPIRVGNQVTISDKDLQTYLYHGFAKLNVYCKENNLSNETSTQEINRWLKENMGISK